MKNLIRGTAIGVTLALIVAGSALAKPQTLRAGNLFLRDNGGIFPSSLPRHTQRPISARINARIGTTDGSHPPAVRTLNIEFDKSIQVQAKGLPVCRSGQLEARDSRAARRKGRKKSYLTASCPTGRYYTRGKIIFSDGTRLQGVHPLPCTPKG